MAKDPAILWYWNDWQGGTITFTRHLKGCYMDLLHAQFNTGRLSLSEIKIVLGVDFSQWEMLKKKFMQDENGNFYNKRIEDEKIKRENFSQRQSINGQKGGRPSKNKPKINPTLNPNKSLLENENEIDNDILKNKRVEEKIFEILHSERWIQDNARVYKCGIETARSYLIQFLDEQRVKDEIDHRTLFEIKSHFPNWLKIELSKSNKNNGKQTNIDAIRNF